MSSIKLQNLLDAWFPENQDASVSVLLDCLHLAHGHSFGLTLVGEPASGKTLLRQILCRAVALLHPTDEVTVHYDTYAKFGPSLNICETTDGPTGKEKHVLYLAKGPFINPIAEDEIDVMAGELATLLALNQESCRG